MFLAFRELWWFQGTNSTVLTLGSS